MVPTRAGRTCLSIYAARTYISPISLGSPIYIYIVGAHVKSLDIGCIVTPEVQHFLHPFVEIRHVVSVSMKKTMVVLVMGSMKTLGSVCIHAQRGVILALVQVGVQSKR